MTCSMKGELQKRRKRNNERAKKHLPMQKKKLLFPRAILEGETTRVEGGEGPKKGSRTREGGGG